MIYFLSILISLIWGVLMLSADYSSDFNTFLSFLFSSLIIFFLQSTNSHLEDRKSKIIISSFPALYVLLSFFIIKEQNYILNPILWNFAWLIFMIFGSKQTSKLVLLGLAVFFGYFYSNTYYQDWKDSISVQKRFSEILESGPLKENLQLQMELLIDSNGERPKLKKGQRILMETWNETCIPCLESINELEGYVDSLYPDINHIYLYVSNRQKFQLNNDEIFNFRFIDDKSSIYKDELNEFYKYSEMSGYPYFILFDENGAYLDHFIGYSSDRKSIYMQRLSQMMNKLVKH